MHMSDGLLSIARVSKVGTTGKEKRRFFSLLSGFGHIYHLSFNFLHVQLDFIFFISTWAQGKARKTGRPNNIANGANDPVPSPALWVLMVVSFSSPFKRSLSQGSRARHMYGINQDI